MIDLKLIRENPRKVKKSCRSKQIDPGVIDGILLIDKKRRALLQEIEGLRKERNGLTKEDFERGQEIKARLKKLEPRLREANERLQKLLCEVPNPPAEDVPLGKGESGNIELRKWGEIPEFDFHPRDYSEIGEELDLIDVKRAAKVSGTRFGYLKNEAVLLEFALVQYVFDLLLKEKFIPVVPPAMIKEEVEQKLGYMEYGGRNDMYILEKDKLVLIATAEHVLVTMHEGEIFEEKDLPRRYVGFSSCFRREAGSYGKDTKGIFRVHQFDKIEMVSFSRPEDSNKEHEYLVSLEEKLMKGLTIPYRVVKMCTGDLGLPAARKYDLEAWFPSQERYRETHSCSNCTDFQARRLNIKVKRQNKVEFVHILNGTAIAVGRTILAILENYQQEDGSVLIPKVLQKYIGKDRIASK